MNECIIWAAPIGLMVPYIGTLTWIGTIQGEELRHKQQKEVSGRRWILLSRISGSYYIDMEEYPPGVIARQISTEYGLEALGAQATITRTYVCRQMEDTGDGEEIAEPVLDTDCLEADQLKKLWSSNWFPEYYKKLEDVVKAISDIAMTYEGKCTDPTYYRTTADMTRQRGSTHLYLQTVDCPGDVEAEEYMRVLSFSRRPFVSDINSIPAGESGSRTIEISQVPDTIQIVLRNDAGYMDTMQIGSTGCTGEEVQYALGLTFSCFVLEPYEGGIRVVVKGIRCGYGLSQITVNEKAKEGWKAEDILGYSYKDIVFIFE